jgi:hypothetical protein
LWFILILAHCIGGEADVARPPRGEPAPEEFIAEKGVQWRVSAYEQEHGDWHAYVLVRNTSAGEISIELSPTVIDHHGVEHRFLPDRGNWNQTTIFLVPAIEGRGDIGGTFDEDPMTLRLGPMRMSNVAGLHFRFDIPAESEPKYVVLTQGGPRFTLPDPGFLPMPELAVRDQPPEVTLSVEKAVRVIQPPPRSAEAWLDTLEDATASALKALDSTVAEATHTYVTETFLNVYKQTAIWLVVSLSVTNEGGLPVEVPINRILTVPAAIHAWDAVRAAALPLPGYATMSEERKFAPLGMAIGSEILLGDPLSQHVAVGANSVSRVVLMFRMLPKIPRWWDRYAIAWKQSDDPRHSTVPSYMPLD